MPLAKITSVGNSLLFNLLLQLILIHDLFEVPQPFRSVLEHLRLLYPLTNNFIEDYLEPN